MAAALILFVRKAAFNEERFPLAAQFPDARKALRAQAGEDIVKGEVHQARVVAVRAEDDAAAQIAPDAQDVPRAVSYTHLDVYKRQLLPHSHVASWSYAVLADVSICYPPVWDRLFTRYSPVRR